MQKEIWKDVIGGCGFYKVSNLGNIRSVSRVVVKSDDSTANRVGKLLTPHPEHRGYMQVTLCFNGVRKTMKVHRIVMEAFSLNPMMKRTINHKNGIKSDNRLCNLEWNTISENIKHAFDCGLKKAQTGETNGNSKLKKSDVIDIKTNCDISPECLNKFAIKYNVTKQAVRLIVNNRNWKHIKI